MDRRRCVQCTVRSVTAIQCYHEEYAWILQTRVEFVEEKKLNGEESVLVDALPKEKQRDIDDDESWDIRQGT